MASLSRFLWPLLLAWLSLGVVSTALAQSCTGTFTYTFPSNVPPGDSLSTGQSLRIASGTFGGTLNINGPGVTICVDAGAEFKPTSYLSLGGRIVNYGDSQFQANLDGDSILDNRAGTLVWASGNVNGTVSLLNAAGASMELPTVTFFKASVFKNDGTVIAHGNLADHGATFDNNGVLTFEGGRFDLTGIMNNNGWLTGMGQVQINGQGVLNNRCSIIVNGSGTSEKYFRVDGALNNHGFALMTVSGSSFINNGGGTVTQVTNAVVGGMAFSNDGAVTGAGRFHFTEDTKNQGTFKGSSASDPIVFYDASPSQTPGNIFDTQNALPVNTVSTEFLRPTENDALTSCAPSFSAPRVDLSVTKTNGVDTLAPGQRTIYTLVVANAGPDGADAARLTDTPDDSLTCTSVLCTGALDATCPTTGTSPGQLSIDNLLDDGVLVDLPANAQLTFQMGCTVAAPP